MKKLLVVLLVLGMVAPAMAAEWNFYGSARAGFFYVSADEDASSALNSTGTDTESDTDLYYYLHSNSRIGANVKTSDAVTGRFEYGTSGGYANIRLLYGEWHFGGGSLLIGQDYTPVDTLYSNQAANTDNGLNNEGMPYEGRIGQLKLKMGGFQAALIPVNLSSGAYVADDADVVLPKIELAYDMKMDTISIGGYAGYMTYTGGQSGADYDVVAWIGGVRGKLNFGPAYVNFAAFYAQNAGNYGLGLSNSYAGSQLVSGTDTEEATTFSGAVAIGAKFSDMVAIEAGFGYMKSEVDNVGTGATGTREGDAMTYYVQLPITLAPGVFIVPEISVFDYGEDDDGVAGTANTENGVVSWYGAKFQINF